MLDRLSREKWLRAAGTFGLFPANRVGTDDLEVYTDETRTAVRTTLHHLRQQGQHREGIPNRSLADFVAPKESGLADYVGAFAVTAGHGSAERVAAFKADLDDYSAILLESLADRLAEAFAERLHQRVRREFWGYAPDEQLARRRPDRRALHAASGRRPATRPAPTTPRRPCCGTCSTSRRRWASRSPSRWRCGRGRRSAAGTSRTRRASTSSSGGWAATRCSEYATRKGWTLSRGRAVARAEPRLHPRGLRAP